MGGIFIKKVFSWLIATALVFNIFSSTFNIQPSAAATTNTTTTTSASGNTFTLNGDILSVSTNASDKIDVQVCAPQIMKVNYKPGGVSDADTLVLDPNKTWDQGNIVSSDLNSDPMIFKTNSMTIKINKSDLGIAVYNASNDLLLKQNTLTNNKSVSFTHGSGQNFYGVGGYNKDGVPTDGTLRTGTNAVYAGGQGHPGAPFTWTTSGYGLLVDSDGGYINIADTSLSYTGISKRNTEYFVMTGTPTEVMSEEAQISGTSPMFPKWATGFTNTQWGWPNTGKSDEDQLKDVITKYRTDGYPIDNFCLDFDWKQWGYGNYGEFNWNTGNFPGGSSGELKNWMDSKGVKITGITKPRLFTGTAEASVMDANGWWLSSSVTTDYCAGKSVKQVNFAKDALRSWWWNQSKASFDSGIVGFWNDECDSDNGFGNFDNMNMERAYYDGQTAYTSNQRVWSINRTYYGGAQRYGYGLWSGDIGSGFQTMKSQKDRLIASVNLGEAKWGMDTGGFNGTPGSENYARWMEFSAFVPIFRVHGQKVPGSSCARYPWNFGDVAASAAKDVMHLRYQLIPYIYKYDQQASETGVGLVKSLMMAYPNDPNTKNDTDAWMFGDSMLVSPVLDQGQTTKSIYLPAGNWIDYFKGTKYTGGKTIQYTVDSKTWKDVPLFIKQGAIIPSQDYENYVGEKKMSNIYLDVFPDSSTTSFDYYDDDGNSTTYKDGNYFKQKLTVSRDSDWKSLDFTTGAKEGTYTPDVQNYIVKLHSKSTGVVTVAGQPLTLYNSLDDLKNATGEGYATGTDIYGDVIYAKVTAGQLKTINAPCILPEQPAQTATVYAKNTEASANLQYSVDGGTTWSAPQAMTQSDKSGYLKTTFTYALTNSDYAKVRYQDSTGYEPTSEGVSIPNGNNTFTVSKDGTVTTGGPVMDSTNIYLQASTKNAPLLQFRDDSGNWSSNIQMTAWPSDSTKYTTSVTYPHDDTAPAVRYSEDGGVTWKPSSDGQVISAGDYMNNNTGAIVAGNPSWKNLTTIYYKGYSNPYIHYRVGTGAWTTAPGVAMAPSTEMAGYTHKITIDLGTGSTLIACFNNGSGSWDSNNGVNYTFNVGTYEYSGGVITKIADPVKTFGIDSFTTNVQAPQIAGTAITLNTVSSGGTGAVQTKFTVNDGTTTTTIKDYSADTTATWTPTAAGTYTLTTSVKDTTGTEVTKTLSYVVKDLVIVPSIDSFTANLVSPQITGTAITLNAVSSGGTGALKTKFEVNDGTTTTTIKDYSADTTATWVPSKAGNYTITTSVKDTAGKEVSKSITYVISDTIAKNQTTIYYKGYIIPYIHYRVGSGTWTTAPGIAMVPSTEMTGYTHKITIDLGTATALTACFNNGSGSWDSNNGSNYTFKAGTYEYSGGVITKIADPIKTFGIDSFTTNVQSPQLTGTAITLSTASSNGTGAVQTKFTVNDGTTTTTIKDYSADTTATWTPTIAGTYTLTTSVKDSTGTEVTKTLSYVVKDLVIVPSIDSFTTSVQSPQLKGTAITLNTASSGGTGALQTKFTVNDGTTTTTLKDYSADTTATWTPTTAGTYTLTTSVKDTAGKEVSKSITYVISDNIAKNQTTIYYKGYLSPYIHYRIGSGSWTTAPGVAMVPTLEMVGYTNKITIDLGTATTLTACFNNGGSGWDSNNGANYTFNAGTYEYSGGVITKIADPVKTFGIDSFTTNVQSPQLTGTAITLNTASSNGTGAVQTKFTVNDGTTTTTIKDYSADTTATWTPSKAGTYSLSTSVKDTTGTEVTKSITYVISDTIAKNQTTIYYKGYASPYIHYKVGNGTWTTAPGVAMTPTTEMAGYTHKIVIDLGTGTTLTACFNNGSGSWDSNNGANYTFNAGKYTYSSGSISPIN